MAGVSPVQFNVFGQTELSTKLGYLGLTLTYADQREVIQFIRSVDGFEYNIASSINSMLLKESKTVGFLTGHGEMNSKQGLAALTQYLSSQYNVTDIEAKKFEKEKFFEDSIKLRKFDEAAKKTNIKIKNIDEYKSLLTSNLL